jgi:hypothetical protein
MILKVELNFLILLKDCQLVEDCCLGLTYGRLVPNSVSILSLTKFYFLLYLYVRMGPKEVQTPRDCDRCCVVPLQVNVKSALVTDIMKERQIACTLSRSL